MYCTKCGTRNEDSANTCVQCGNALRAASFGTPVTPPSATPPPPVTPESPSTNPAIPQAPQTPPAPIAQAYLPPPTPQSPYGQPRVPYSGPPIPNYLAPAIIVTVLCSCIFITLPFGIVAIVFAAQVNGKVAVGDIPGALSASRMAKIFTWVAFGIGLGIFLIYFVLVMIGVTAGFWSNVH